MLAIFVALSHLNYLGITVSKFHIGAFGVVGFYMLSGYVMNHNIMTYYKGMTARNLRLFYTDRAIRIFPQYLFFMGIAMLFVFTTGYKEPVFDLLPFIHNLLIIPLNFYMFVDISFFEKMKQAFPLVPPAWSLGTELQFYILVPFLLYFSRSRYALFVLSYFVFTISSLGIINTQIYGYRLLPGVLFIFLGGTFLFDGIVGKQKMKLLFLLVFMCLSVLLMGYLYHRGLLFNKFTSEILFGFIAFIAVMAYLSGMDRNNKIDVFLGNLSYGVFLAHYLVIWLCDYVDIRTSSMVVLFLVPLSAIALSAIGYYGIDRKVREFRKAFRAKSLKARQISGKAS